ncbi:hypothetical protein [Sneathiella aquimaris]|uniref:hypothetical protein n=1 Tax=Sneathiella aquimaris TaxID=2599305 RepID=UPI00146D2E4B|nr:hypothetical protein [Sneathiella aquimaris]
MMSGSEKKTIDVNAEVAAHLSGEKGFGNSKMLSKHGMQGYSEILAGRLAEKLVAQNNDPRRRKRSARK